SSGPTPAPGATAPRLAAYRKRRPVPAALAGAGPTQTITGTLASWIRSASATASWSRVPALSSCSTSVAPVRSASSTEPVRYVASVRSIEPSTLATRTEGVSCAPAGPGRAHRTRADGLSFGPPGRPHLGIAGDPTSPPGPPTRRYGFPNCALA